MIDLYSSPTPNGAKILLFLEEAGLPYQVNWLNLGTGEQFKPEFLKISPNNRIPAIVDNAPVDGGEPISVFESGAILIYLAEKIGRFMPTSLRDRKTALEWVFWQVGGLGADVRSESSLRALRTRENSLRDRPLRQGNQPTLWGAESAPEGNRRFRAGPGILHRGYGGVSLGELLGTPKAEFARVSRTWPMARNDQRAAGDRARGGRRKVSHRARHAFGRGKAHVVRSNRGERAKRGRKPPLGDLGV